MISATLLSQLPQDLRRLVRGVLNRSVADFEKLCDRLPGCSASELCILQPVLYMYLDPDRIPEKPTPAVTTDIELVYWSLLAIVVTLGYIDGSGADSPAGSEKRYLISSWNCVTPWLVFFHDKFIMCRANYRPIDRMSVIKIVTSLLFQVPVIGGNRDGTTGVPIIPILYRPIAELWLLALKTKDKDVVCLSVHSGAHITSFRVFGSFLVAECIRNESFVTILLDVSGVIDTVTSAALKYVKNIRLMAKDPDIASNAFKLNLLVPMFSCCVGIIATTSMHSAAMREAYILHRSIKEIFSALRVLQSLPPGGGSMVQALGSSFAYLVFLLKRADDPVSAFHQALRAHAFETMVHIGPSGHLEVQEEVEADPHKINEIFFLILFSYVLHNKILTYACKHVDAWSDNLGPIVRQDGHLWDVWSKTEQMIRSCGISRSGAEMTQWPSPSEKGWVLQVSRRLHCFIPADLSTYYQCSCGGTAEDIHLRQCAGCQVVRYCSKRCQRDSWYSHHKLSCNFLKAAVGSSTPHHVKRSLCLLAALEEGHMERKWDNIRRLVAAAQCEYPKDRERLVVELALDRNTDSVRPLRHYLFLFNGLSENEIVDCLSSSWPDPRGYLRQLFFCSVVTINDRYLSRQFLFSPRTALDMEIVPQSLSRNRQCV
ncbi:hypothetical protein DFJ58DRAFT_812003 [Suillus subalutaceus]|uniref:uncharacterized protein n=1 Tax=Suillus subalutaceus TaxID=48586 RepID=UPI001B86A7ED|nr:uncharacterized protein DFJ58DRAFT_812003 [Suillus subalutaceus]KAG1839549.1 hypothetical protein DFJ58DRAFT_812003 [Suillus subalutaceus]